MNPSCFSDRKGALYLEPTALSTCSTFLVLTHQPLGYTGMYADVQMSSV
jgi:hypothetical protein